MCHTYKDRKTKKSFSKPHRENIKPYVRQQKQYVTFDEDEDYVQNRHL